jgi:hypothetical protein
MEDFFRKSSVVDRPPPRLSRCLKVGLKQSASIASLASPSWNEASLLGWNDSEVSEVATGVVPDPQADPPLLAVTQLIHHQAWFFRLINEDAHLRTRNGDARAEPIVGVRHGTDGLLVTPWMLGPQLLPRVGRVGDVLDGADTSCRIFRPEVERAEVDRVIGRPIQPVKSQADKALLRDVLAPEIKLNRAVGELNPFEISDAVAGAFVEMDTSLNFVAEAADVAVEELETFAFGELNQVRVDGLVLTADTRGDR